MVTWNLAQIISKVRNLTGTPYAGQLSDSQITDYINTYYVYTMPFELKEQRNQQPFNFNTFANVGVYNQDNIPNFAGFQTDEPMCYANGYPLVFYQDRDIFFQDWPQQYTQDQVGTGDAVTTTFTGTCQAFPVIQGSFLITDGTQVLTDDRTPVVGEIIAIGNGGAAYLGNLALVPIQPGSLEIGNGTETFTDNGLGVLNGSAGGTGTINYTTGAWTVTFNAVVANGVQILADYSFPSTSGVLIGNGSGTINYLTGVFSATFTNAPASGLVIYDNYQAYQPARPQGVLFYNNEFTFRPIPDQVYAITLQGFITQDPLNSGAELPLQTEWGQLIAYGAAIDIFADRGDLVSYNTYYPLFKRFENVALARFVQQYTNAQSVPRF